MLAGVLIFLMAVGGAIVYGIVHDLITTQICVEYFTLGHPPVFGGLTDPMQLALVWGIIATWWVGAILGMPLALAARAGRLPPMGPRELIWPLAAVLVAMGICAALSGTFGYLATVHQWIRPTTFAALRISADKRAAFMGDLWAHLASYFSGFCGGFTLIGWVLIQRYKAEVARRLALRREAEMESGDEK